MSTQDVNLHASPRTATPPLQREDARGTTTRRKTSHAWTWLVLIVLLAAGAGYWWYTRDRAAEAASEKHAAQSQAGRAVPVVAATAKTGDLPIYIDALGSVTPLNIVTVRTRVDGQIDSINFTEGQLVHEGDLLAQIDPRPFQVQLEQTQAQLAKDQATLNNARVELERDKLAEDAIPKQQLDTQQALVDQLQASLKIDQAQIDNAKLQLDYARITAPISGRIGLRTVDKGNMIHATDTSGIAVITQVQPISIVFSISEDQLPPVLKKYNQGQKLQADAWDRELQNKIAAGALTAGDNRVDPSTGTIRLKAEFANEEGTLYPNQFVNVRLLVDTVRKAVIVPAAAIQRGPESMFVYVVKQDDTVEVRNVTLGASEGDRTIVETGLAEGELVVTDGVDKLQAGSKVTVRKPSTSRPSTMTSEASETKPS